MKRIIVLLILIIVSAAAFAQTTYKVEVIRTAKINIKTNTWIWSEPDNDVDMIITVDEYDVYFDNEEGTHVKLISGKTEKKIKGGVSYSYAGIDQDKFRCTVQFVVWDDDSRSQVYLTYANIQAAYTLSFTGK